MRQLDEELSAVSGRVAELAGHPTIEGINAGLTGLADAMLTLAAHVDALRFELDMTDDDTRVTVQRKGHLRIV